MLRTNGRIVVRSALKALMIGVAACLLHSLRGVVDGASGNSAGLDCAKFRRNGGYGGGSRLQNQNDACSHICIPSLRKRCFCSGFSFGSGDHATTVSSFLS